MRFNFEATGIGSVPFKDSQTACRLILDNFKEIPFWPQLPARSFKEHMYCQFSEGLPGVVIDEKKKAIYIDSKKFACQMEQSYQKCLDQDTDYFRISEEYAEGLYAFCDIFKKSGTRASFLKGHVTGPVSFALSVTDEKKRAVIYDKDMFEVIAKVLSMKAKWQIKKLKALGADVIMFIDEPYLVSIGSSFVNIPLDGVVKALDEVNSSIKEEGALSGVHCCGNTDWSILLKSGIDILNFDAYNFLKEFFLYASDIKIFLQDGGTIAWGVVPSSEAVDSETAQTIMKKLKMAVKLLQDKGVDKNIMRSIITPSCGLGTLAEDRTKRIMELTRAVSEGMRV